MDELNQGSEPSSREERCHRCLQPVPPNAARCPHCGDPLKHGNARMLLIGLAGSVIFLIAAFGMTHYLQNRPAAAPETVAAPAPPSDTKPALGQ